MKTMSFVTLMVTLLTISSISAKTQHRDGCKEFGDPCNCPGLTGYCLTGWQSNPPDQLYCDCSSDVHTEDDIISLMIKKFCDKGNAWLREKFAYRTLDTGEKVTRFRKSASIFNELFRILGENPTDGAIAGTDTAKLRQNTQNVRRLREELKVATRMEKIVPLFITTDGICFYVNQECTCSNTGRKGVCSARRNPAGEEPQLICHCD